MSGILERLSAHPEGESPTSLGRVRESWPLYTPRGQILRRVGCPVADQPGRTVGLLFSVSARLKGIVSASTPALVEPPFKSRRSNRLSQAGVTLWREGASQGLEQTGKWIGANHFGKERRQTAEVGARRIIAETQRKERRTSEGLKLLSGNDKFKVALAQRLRRETTMDLQWIAKELGLGSWKYLSNLLNRETHTSSKPRFNL